MPMTSVESHEFYTFWMRRGCDESLREKKALPGHSHGFSDDIVVGAQLYVHSEEETGVPAAVLGFSAYGYESAKEAAWVALRAALRTGEELGWGMPHRYETWVRRGSLDQVEVAEIERRDGREVVATFDEAWPEVPFDEFVREWCPLDQFTRGAPVEPTTKIGGDPDS